MTELFSVIRMAYAATFADAVASSASAHVEAALRRDDGSLALDGEYELPMRADLVPRRGSQAGKLLAVDSHTRMQFSVHTLPLPPAIVYVAPFVWDDVALRIGGLVPQQVGAVLAPWFMDWFDAEDANRLNEEGLFGVVHFASDPRPEGAMVAVELHLCGQRGIDPVTTYDELVVQYKATVRGPFNMEARRKAGFSEEELRALLH